jgi:hypothetical protein
LEQAYEKEGATAKSRNIFKYVFTGLAVGSLGTSGVSWVLGNTAYTNYENSVASDIAIEYRDQSQTYDIIKLSAGGVGIVLIALSFFNWFKKDNRSELGQAIEALSAQIAELEAK